MGQIGAMVLLCGAGEPLGGDKGAGIGGGLASDVPSLGRDGVRWRG